MTTATAAPKSKAAQRFKVVLEDDGEFRINGVIDTVLDEFYAQLDDLDAITETVFNQVPQTHWEIMARRLTRELVEKRIGMRNRKSINPNGGSSTMPTDVAFKPASESNADRYRYPKGAMASVLDPDGKVRWWVVVDQRTGGRKEIRECTLDDLDKLIENYRVREESNRAYRLRVERLRDKLRERGFTVVSQLPEEAIEAAITSEDF